MQGEGRRGAPRSGHAPAQPAPLTLLGILPVELNGARRGPPGKRSDVISLVFAQPGVSREGGGCCALTCLEMHRLLVMGEEAK